MRKPLHLLTPEEKAQLKARLKAKAELEGDIPFFIGNAKSLFACYHVSPRRSTRVKATSARSPAMKKARSKIA